MDVCFSASCSRKTVGMMYGCVWSPHIIQLSKNESPELSCKQSQMSRGEHGRKSVMKREEISGFHGQMPICRYPLVNSHDYGTWPEIVDFSIKNCDFP